MSPGIMSFSAAVFNGSRRVQSLQPWHATDTSRGTPQEGGLPAWGLGTLYATIGEAAQAQAALSTAIAMDPSMAMTVWWPQTEAALGQVATRAP
jgi:hypothetical protein